MQAASIVLGSRTPVVCAPRRRRGVTRGRCLGIREVALDLAGVADAVHQGGEIRARLDAELIGEQASEPFVAGPGGGPVSGREVAAYQ